MTFPEHPRIAVACITQTRLSEATALAKKWEWPLVESMESMDQFDYGLIYTADFLGLQGKTTPLLHINFLSPQLAWRLQHASLRKELLARAVGQSPRDKPVIIDATAGWGRDSFILAALGFEVIMLEQSPLLHAMLSDAIARARVKLPDIMARLNLIHTNAQTWLPRKQADIVYLDPMFPKRKKTASAKKELTILQNLLLKSDNVHCLMEAALACASYRVVVKRHRLAEPLSMHKPHFSLTGKSSRFDVYCRS